MFACLGVNRGLALNSEGTPEERFRRRRRKASKAHPRESAILVVPKDKVSRDSEMFSVKSKRSTIGVGGLILRC